MVTERFLDRLVAQRGAGFAELLIKECRRLEFESLVIYGVLSGYFAGRGRDEGGRSRHFV